MASPGRTVRALTIFTAALLFAVVSGNSEPAAASEHGATSHGGGETSHGGGETAHGGGETAHGEAGEHESEEFDGSTTVLLFSSLVFMFGLLYLVKSSVPMVVRQTWSVMANIVSIFVAVMVFSQLEDLMKILEHATGTHAVGVHACGFACLCFVICLIITLVLLLISQRNWECMRASLAIVAHVTGFGCLQVIGHLQNLTTGTNEGGTWAWALFGWVCGSAITFGMLSVFTKGIVPKLIHPHGRDGWTEEFTETRFEEVLEEYQIDALALASSNTLVRVLCTMITGSIPHLIHLLRNHSRYERNWLAITALGLTIMGAAATTVLEKIRHRKGHYDSPVSMMVFHDYVDTFLNFMAAWAWIMYGRWEIYESVFADRLLFGHIVWAMSSTLFSMVFIWAFHSITDRTNLNDTAKVLKDVTVMMGLVCGLAWELSFDVVMEGVTEAEHLGTAFKPLVSIGLVIVMMPAYVMYLFPEMIAYEHAKEAEQELSEEEDEDEEGDVHDIRLVGA